MRVPIQLLVLFALSLALPASAQAPLTEYSSDTLNLRFSYPSDLTKADAAEAVKDGHLTLLGISGDSDPALAAATRCLRPDLLTKSATATILLAELDVTCLTPEQQANAKDLLANMAELVTKVPGMSSIAPPAWYNVGWQKIHMAAAQGSPQSAAGDAAPQRLYTMGFSTSWNNHLLVWFFSSTDIPTLNRITKSTVRFGRSAAAPLYASAVNDAGPKN
jgi:hypothetical protein